MKTKIGSISFILLSWIFCSAQDESLRIAVDHFSRTTSPGVTAAYWIEVVNAGNIKAEKVRISVTANSLVHIQPADTLVGFQNPFRLFVRGKEPDNYKLTIRATVGRYVESRQVWFHVVQANSRNPKLILDAVPEGQLEQIAPQSLEGAIVPAIGGLVKVQLLSPTKQKHEIDAPVDEAGLFCITHSFDEMGQWLAQAKWGYHTGQSTLKSAGIKFKVKARPIRLTVSANGFRDAADGEDKQPVPSSIRVVGQVATDFPQETDVDLQVIDPYGKETQTSAVKLDSKSGKFWASFTTKGQRGQFTIRARATGPASAQASNQAQQEILYASLSSPPEPVTNGTSSVFATSTINSGVPAGYAVIVVGYNENTFAAELALAFRLHQALILHRGFRRQDILVKILYTSTGIGAPEMDQIDYAKLKTEIAEFLEDRISAEAFHQDFAAHKSLLFFWIGEHDNNGSVVKFKGGDEEIDANQIAQIYTNALLDQKFDWDALTAPEDEPPLLNFYSNIVFVHTGNKSGLMLNLIDDVLHSTFSSTSLEYHVMSSRSGQANETYSTLCGQNSFAHFFREALVANKKTLGAFKHGWSSTAQNPEIDSNMDRLTENATTIQGFGDNAGLQIGYGIGYGELKPEPYVAVSSSPVNGPQLGSKSTVYVSFDNPNDYPIRDVSLTINSKDSAATSDNCCFKLKPVQIPGRGSTIWKAEVDAYKSKGFYPGNVFVDYDDPVVGSVQFTGKSFNRVSHNLAKPKASPVEPRLPKSSLIDFDPSLEIGYGYISNQESQMRFTRDAAHFLAGINLFSTPGGHYQFLGIAAATDFDNTWFLVTPVSISLGKVLGLGVFSQFWVYGGLGYELETSKRKLRTDNLRFSVGAKLKLFSFLRREKHSRPTYVRYMAE